MLKELQRKAEKQMKSEQHIINKMRNVIQTTIPIEFEFKKPQKKEAFIPQSQYPTKPRRLTTVLIKPPQLTINLKGKKVKLEMRDDEIIRSGGGGDNSNEKMTINFLLGNHNKECPICTTNQGWWCRKCDLILHLQALKEILHKDDNEIKKISLFVQGKNGKHPNLIPCIHCNKQGNLNRKVLVKNHEKSEKDVEFWNKINTSIISNASDIIIKHAIDHLNL